MDKNLAVLSTSFILSAILGVLYPMVVWIFAVVGLAIFGINMTKKGDKYEGLWFFVGAFATGLLGFALSTFGYLFGLVIGAIFAFLAFKMK